MICKRIKPITELSKYIKEYLILHVLFDTGAAAPVKSYPVNPEEGMTFHVKGSLYAESPELGISETRAQTVIFGQPESRQNLYLSHEFLMVHIRFQPGGLFKLIASNIIHIYLSAVSLNVGTYNMNMRMT